MRQLTASQLKEWLADTTRAKPVLLDVREPWNGPGAWWQPGRCAARPARAHEPTKREREATRCTELTDHS